MSFTPPPHPDTRPRQDAVVMSDPDVRDFVQSWLSHVEAGRIGDRQDTPDDIRAIVLANERLICAGRRSPSR